MNHLIKKFKFSGGGSKPKPQPATLQPPKLGVHQLASSFSYAETLDLISDGPIEGLVNKNGSRVEGLNALQGIYMDDTPIAVSDDNVIGFIAPTSVSSYDTTNTTITSALASSIINTSVANLAQVSSPFRNVNIYSRDGNGAVRSVSISNWTKTDFVNSYSYKHNTKNFYFISPRERIKQTTTSTLNLYNPTPDVISKIGDFNGFNNFVEISTNPSFKQQYINTLFKGLDKSLSFRDSISQILTQELAPQQISGKASGYSNFAAKSVLVMDASQFVFSNIDANAFLSNGELNPNIGLSFTAPTGFTIKTIYNYAYPNLDTNGLWDGTLGGFIVFVLNASFNVYYNSSSSFGYGIFSIPKNIVESIGNITQFVIGQVVKKENAQKYNYTNILAEVKKGEEFQLPMRYFNQVFIDKTIGSRLFGPFRTSGQVQKINDDDSILKANYTLNSPSGYKFGIPDTEGSNDIRQNSSSVSQDFSNWDKNALSWDEEATPVAHIIENPNVESVFVSLQVDGLSDTANRDRGTGDDKVAAGSRFPGVVNVEIEIGKIDEQGVEIKAYNKIFQIIALVESPTIIDIGNPDSRAFEAGSYKYIKDLNQSITNSSVFNPLPLPSAFGQSRDEETPVKRYVRIKKLSTETNSILVAKVISVNKVTEIIPVNCSYPFSAIIGTKVDARTFDSIPTRTFDARLKKVKIPSNYYPIIDNVLLQDKRYYNTIAQFEAQSHENKIVYDGDWDGTFKFAWTDNPAWVLYDLLTSDRYGLGQYIDEDDINKWDLYKIGRFCDAVDDNGVFVGVPDGRGGLEPRYSCNIMFQEGTKIFDAINIIATLFRGSVFYNNNEINFLDDRLREPTALFANTNVKDGFFSYANYRRDEQFNAVEVIYIDRFDNFKSKVEYIEDEEDIVKRGIFKKQVNALGVTSKAMAYRVGKHLIYQTIQENQSVTFVAGNEALLCKPGDLILIEDELKSLKSNFGRVLAVDSSAKTIRISEPYISSDYTSGITIYSPTGQITSTDLDILATGYRERLTGFSITGSGQSGILESQPPYSFTGQYAFSGYSRGYTNRQSEGLFEYYAVYTGANSPLNIIYYGTGYTGWVFAQERAFTNDSIYDLFIANTGFKSLGQLATGNIHQNVGADFRDYAPYNTSGNVFSNRSGQMNDVTRGAVESEIALVTTPQITTLSITGYSNESYGALLYVDTGDINADLLTFIPEGSAYRIQRLNAEDQIYKVMSVREENPNEYSIVASKYNSGKYDLIENSTSIDFMSDTFGYGTNSQVNDVNYVTLDNPTIVDIQTGNSTGDGIYISGRWSGVTNATGYNVILRYPNQEQASIFTTQTGYKFEEITAIGSYIFAVNALGNSANSLTSRYFDSNYSIYQLNNFILTNMTPVRDNLVIKNISIQ